MEEHNGTQNARKHEQGQNHSLGSMSTTKIVIIHKTKNVRPLLGKKGPSIVMCVSFGRPASRWQCLERHNWAVMGG